MSNFFRGLKELANDTPFNLVQSLKCVLPKSHRSQINNKER
jgi:hypothetical protein